MANPTSFPQCATLTDEVRQFNQLWAASLANLQAFATVGDLLVANPNISTTSAEFRAVAAPYLNTIKSFLQTAPLSFPPA